MALKIHVLCVSKRPSDWVDTASKEYLKRLTGQLSVSIKELSPASKTGDSASVMQKEALKLKQATPTKAYRIALDERGAAWSTQTLAEQLNAWRSEHADVVCYIGGAQGLDPTLRGAAEICWSLSPLTLPHQMVRVIVIEQLYRAWSLLHNHPYHRA